MSDVNSNHTLPESVQQLTPAARWVYRELLHADHTRLTFGDLQHRTGYSLMTLRRARHELVDAAVVIEGYTETDPRERYLELDDSAGDKNVNE